MSMSTHVKLLRDKSDPTYRNYLEILLACKNAKVKPPIEVDNYFGSDGVYNDPEYPLEIDFQPRLWNHNECQGFEIDIDQIPKGVKTIRFYNSW